MSVVSGSQMNFGASIIPRAAAPGKPEYGDNNTPTSVGGNSVFGEGGREFSGPRSVTPIASGAFSSQDRALSMRQQEGSVLSHSAKSVGSWLFKMD
jgi:hypothetical protein